MDRLTAMSFFVTASDAGSLSAAGRELGVPLTTVSRNVSELEAHLGAQLFTRTSRQLALTDVGRSYLAACKRVLDDVHEAERSAAGEHAAPRGELIITAPTAFGRRHVVPLVAELLAAYPGIDVQLLLTDRRVVLVEERVDLAVRVGELLDSSLRAIRVGACRQVVCASPRYWAARGTPRKPADLAGHDCITLRGFMPKAVWTFRGTPVAVRSRLVVDTADAAAAAAVAGAGVTSTLSYLVADGVRDGTLVIALERFEPPPRPVNLVFAPNRFQTQRLRAFCDFAVPRLRAMLTAGGLLATLCLLVMTAGCASAPPVVASPEYLRAKAAILRTGDSSEHDFTVHSHNDFQQEHPLQDALGLGYRSAEVDVIDRSDEVRVTHIGLFTQGSLKELYLDPLQEIVNRRGSVHGDGKPFYLWIEVRAIFSGADVVPLLRSLLARYPMLETFDERGHVVHPGSVIAIVCGYSGYKGALFRGQPVFPAYLAGVSYDVSHPSRDLGEDGRMKWVALRWTRYVDWDGDGPIPLPQLERLERLIVSLHQHDLKVRFFSNPQTQAFWDLMRDVGVDQAGTDELRKVRAMIPEGFFAVAPSPPPP